jgi:peptidoglycan/LPS O-acetylase OafA/YrhL
VTATAAAPSPAVAPPPGNPRFALFDSLRGLAALAILSFHVASLTGSLSDPVAGDLLSVLGPRALVLFFVISGFLLYRPYVAARAAERPGPRTGRYLRRRALRIVPAFWVALTVLAIYPGITGVFSEDWWRYYGFLQLYSHETLPRGIPVAWSLCVEVTFYLSLPLWAYLVRRLHWGSWVRTEYVCLAVVAAIGIVFQVLGAQEIVSDIVASSLLGQITWLALGMAIAVASVADAHSETEAAAVRGIREHPTLCWLGGLAALGGLAILLKHEGLLAIVQALSTEQDVPTTLLAIALTGVLGALFVLPAVFGENEGGLPRKLLAWRPIAWLGLVSYGIFLWHLPIAQWMSLSEDPLHFSAEGLGLLEHIGAAQTPIMIVLVTAVTAVMAGLSYYLVELPFLRRKEA